MIIGAWGGGRGYLYDSMKGTAVMLQGVLGSNPGLVTMISETEYLLLLRRYMTELILKK